MASQGASFRGLEFSRVKRWRRKKPSETVNPPRWLMVISRKYGCFLKWWYPQNTPKWSFLVGKPMVVGYHHFRKPRYCVVNDSVGLMRPSWNGWKNKSWRGSVRATSRKLQGEKNPGLCCHWPWTWWTDSYTNWSGEYLINHTFFFIGAWCMCISIRLIYIYVYIYIYGCFQK